jgi:zeaxanthin epoxidase
LQQSSQPLRVIVAGGGLGGLALASTLINDGYDVHVFEQAKQYKPFGGPIQIQSNALWALREINPILYSAVEEVGVRTGDRLSGIKDGRRYEEGWLVKFDAATPARKGGLPLTLAINRVVLQDIFLKYGVPRERVHTSSKVVSYTNIEGGGVEVILEDGKKVYGDMLIGADGIWSRVKHHMEGLDPAEAGPKFATKHARYSGYTCFTGTCKHTPDDIEAVAYKVFLGQQQYLGATDCGHGWQHWWAFLPDPPGTPTADNEPMLDRLKREFDEWSPEIHNLFDATKPEVVKKRDLFDRLPLWIGWTDGCVALLGDACHPTMPNLGQGGAMAIEDAYVLGEIIRGIQHTDEIPARLKAYERRRFVRASIAQYLSRNGSDLLVDWETLRTTPIIGEIAMWCINVFQPLTMNYLYSAKF